MLLIGWFGLWLLPVSALPVRAQDDAGWLLGQINGLRASQGLAPFTINGALTNSAQGHSVYLANNPWVDAHREADGSTPRSRMAAAGYTGTYVGENVYGGGLATASIAYNWWLGSPVHYSGLVNVNFREIGIGMARGAYGTFYTLNFGGGGAGGGAAPPAAIPPTSANPVKVNQPVSTRASTRRPLSSAIPSNTPLPDTSPTFTFTPIPTLARSATPQSAPPTATAYIFELDPGVQDTPQMAVTLTPSPTVQRTLPTATVLKVALVPTQTRQAVAEVVMPSPYPTYVYTLAPTQTMTVTEPSTTRTSSNSGDLVRSLIPVAIGVQVVILAGIAFRRGRQ